MKIKKEKQFKSFAKQKIESSKLNTLKGGAEMAEYMILLILIA